MLRTAHTPVSAGLEALFWPASVAVIGASADPTKLSGRPLRYLNTLGYRGRVYPVNPRYAELDGRACFADVRALPEPPDVALVLSPAESVPDIVRTCGEAGAKFAVVIASGFAEAGDADRQAALWRAAEATGIRIVGPNCVGVLSTPSGLTATFSTVLQRGMVPAGPISVVSQSGALANSLLQSLGALGLGVRHWISLGNEVDLSALEVLDFLVDDPGTTTIVLFIEAFKDGQRLVQMGRRATAANKRVVLLRGGQSELGRQASLSHTGKLASTAGISRHLARQAGVVQVDSMAELLETVQLAALADGPWIKGLSVLTVSGGQGVLIGDAAARHAVPLTQLAPSTRQQLAQILPPTLASSNPVDVALLGTNDRYVACARAVLADPGTTHMLWVLSSLANRYDELGGPLLHLAAEAREQGKRLLLTYLSPSDPLPASQEAVLRAAGVPVYPYPEQAVAALGRLRRTDYPAPPAGMHEPLPTRTPGASPPWTRIEHLLRQAGISLPRSSVVHSPEEAEAAAAQLGTPVALKVLAPTLAHKTEAGAVRLGLSSPDAVRAAAEELLTPLPAHVREGGIEGLLVQEMILGGLEIIIGATWDLEFGPILTIGAGGVLTELLGDSVVLGLPVVEEEVRHALRSTRIARLLGGFRGAPPADEEALVRCALGLAELYARESWIGEIELNPVAVLPHGAVALDALVVPARSEQAHGTAG